MRLLLSLATLLFATGAHAACGTASFYAEAHHGKAMANGQPFNMNAKTAAMWGVPFGTRYRVTASGKSVIVTITDRGPNRRLGRLLDLSKAAFAELAPTSRGLVRVCIEKV